MRQNPRSHDHDGFGGGEYTRNYRWTGDDDDPADRDDGSFGVVDRRAHSRGNSDRGISSFGDAASRGDYDRSISNVGDRFRHDGDFADRRGDSGTLPFPDRRRQVRSPSGRRRSDW